MKEFIENLIERLGESVSLPKMERMECRVGKKQTQGFVLGVRSSVEIVNQLAEEYKDINTITDFLQYVRNNADNPNYENDNGWSLADLIDLSIKFCKAEEYNNGWIPCSERLPEEKQEVMLTFKNSAGLHVGEATYKNNVFFYVTDTEFGYYEEVYKNPIAWKLKDVPYQPKGE